MVQRTPAQERTHKKARRRYAWRHVAPRLAFIAGVPVGIGVGAFTAALIGVDAPWVADLFGNSDAAAWGVVVGTISGALFGIGAAMVRLGSYEYDTVEVDIPACFGEEALIRNLHVLTAWHHYVLVQHAQAEQLAGIYFVYEPMLAPTIAAGPLTISAEYLSLVAQISSDRATISGPLWLVEFLEKNLLNPVNFAELLPASKQRVEPAGRPCPTDTG